jgi:hypothetical protein
VSGTWAELHWQQHSKPFKTLESVELAFEVVVLFVEALQEEF